MRITMNTGTDHQLYNCHMRACMLYEFPDALVEIQVVGDEPGVWLYMGSETDLDNFFKRHCLRAAVKSFNRAEACNPYAVEAFGNQRGVVKV